MAPSTCAQESKGAASWTARFSPGQLELLAEAGERLSGPQDLSSVLRRVSAFVVPRLADWYVLVFKQADGHLHAVAHHHRDPSRRLALGELAAATLFDRLAGSMMARAGAGTLGWMPRMTEGAGSAATEVCGWSDADFAQLGTGSLICVPLTNGTETTGAMLLARRDVGSYAPAMVEVAAEIGQRVGVMLANACGFEALQDELHHVNEALAVAAHELRTPTAALRGVAQLLLRRYERGDEVDGDHVRASLSRIDRQAVRLAGMVERLMDTACIDSGKMTVVRSEADLRELVMNVVEAAQAVHPERLVVVDAPRSVAARFDALRIEQVLSNLLDNAFKFSPRDTPVEITLRVSGTGTAVLAVRDHGAGVPVERRHQIFDRFVQAHRDQGPAGLGLGLYLSRRIVEQHGGRLSADYPRDGGARFVVELPALEPISSEYRVSEDREHGGTPRDNTRAQSDRSARGRSGRSASRLRSARIHRAAGVPGPLATCASA